MTVYLVKHHVNDSYAGDDGYKPAIIKGREKAYRFPNMEAAEKCQQKMPIPITWVIVSAEFMGGRYRD